MHILWITNPLLTIQTIFLMKILAKTDVVRYFTKINPDEKIVGEYMSPYYAWQYFGTPLYKAVLKMIDEKISRIIIRNRDEIPVGILHFVTCLRCH